MVFLGRLRPTDVRSELLIDREGEADWLEHSISAYLADRDPEQGQAFCILGSKGVGKSILTRKVLQKLKEIHAGTTVFVDVDCRGALKQRKVLKQVADIYPEVHGRRSWNLARAIREAGYEARAHEILIRLEVDKTRGELVPLKPDALLELGHIELERGSLAKAREYYREVRESSSGGPPSRQALYAEVYDGVVGLVEGTTSGLESRLLEIAGEADGLGDLRLSMLVDLVVGDLWLQTDRFDGARKRYSAAREKAEQLGDLLAMACTFEKSARLEEALDRKQEALTALLRGSDLDIATEHHVAAERQLRRAAELADQQGLSEHAGELRARALEQQRAAELHEVDDFTLSKRAEGESGKASAASPSATETGEVRGPSTSSSSEEPASDDYTPE